MTYVQALLTHERAVAVRRIYLGSALFILCAAAIAKAVSAFGTAGILSVNDPLLQVPNRALLIVVAAVEVLTGGTILLCRKPRWSCLASAVLGTEFLVYRTFRLIGAFPPGCPCLGRLGSWLPLSDHALNAILWVSAGWLCLGGYLALMVTTTHGWSGGSGGGSANPSRRRQGG